jgi:hypothetical protein
MRRRNVCIVDGQHRLHELSIGHGDGSVGQHFLSPLCRRLVRKPSRTKRMHTMPHRSAGTQSCMQKDSHRRTLALHSLLVMPRLSDALPQLVPRSQICTLACRSQLTCMLCVSPSVLVPSSCPVHCCLLYQAPLQRSTIVDVGAPVHTMGGMTRSCDTKQSVDFRCLASFAYLSPLAWRLL